MGHLCSHFKWIIFNIKLAKTNKQYPNSMSNLNQLLAEFEQFIPLQHKTNDLISKSSVGWQIEHVLLTINKISEAVKKSDPTKYKWQFKLPRLLVFSMNKIPRGRAKAPSIVTPETFDELSLKQHLSNTLISLQELETLNQKNYFQHPFFGNLKLKQTIKFLEIHTQHHLSIIKDIVKN